jgi:protein TonB
MTGETLAGTAQDDLPPPAEATSRDEEPVELVVAAEPGAVLRPLLPLAIVISCALHAVAAAAILISTAALPEYGVLEEETDTLSLEMTQSVVLESTMRELVDATAAAAAAMPRGSVAAVDADPDPLPETQDVPIEKDAAPPTIKSAEVDPDAAEASEEPLEVLSGSGEPAEAVRTKAAKQEVDVKEERRKKEREQVRRQRSKQQTAGGPTSRSNASKVAASARASASRGTVLSYAARVRAKVARNKPSGRGHRGTARVAFGVSSSGGLSYARLARSSGNAALDQAALSAVRRAAPFGAPPAGTTSAQLRFSIPFYFR